MKNIYKMEIKSYFMYCYIFMFIEYLEIPIFDLRMKWCFTMSLKEKCIINPHIQGKMSYWWKHALIYIVLMHLSADGIL